MRRAEYLTRWSAAHGGVRATGVVRWWLVLTHSLSLPLARTGVHPNTVTGSAVLLAAVVPAVAAAGGRWYLLAALVVLASGLCDNLDGAVALISGRSSPLGAVLDAVGDRVADAAYVLALAVAGAPTPLCLAAVGLAWLHEYLRARAAQAGMSEVGVVTVGERPTRVVVTLMFLLAAGVYPAAAPAWAVAGAAALVATGALGLAQLSVVVTRRLG